MGITYSQQDFELVDYELYSLMGSRWKNSLFLRGPIPKTLAPKQYFVCLGAAQTFGRFCPKPYGTLLSENLSFSSLNFGFGGAGAEFFLERSQILDYVNNAKFVIVQVMSGRSQSNSWIHKKGKNNISEYVDLLKQNSNDLDFVNRVISETRTNWVNSYIQLFDRIQVPIILFWFLIRKPDYIQRYDNVYQLLGKYPQLINLETLENIKNYSDEYVECVSNRGMPQKLIGRFTGMPVIAPYAKRKDSYNQYYPSPEMHIDAANMLEPICQKYIESS